jgi:kinesin family protein C2/C3
MSRDSEAFNIKTPSPGFSNRRQGSCDLLSSQTNFRQPMEDVGNIEVTKFSIVSSM